MEWQENSKYIARHGIIYDVTIMHNGLCVWCVTDLRAKLAATDCMASTGDLSLSGHILLRTRLSRFLHATSQPNRGQFEIEFVQVLSNATAAAAAEAFRQSAYMRSVLAAVEDNKFNWEHLQFVKACNDDVY